MAINLEDALPVVKYNGLNTAKDVSITGTLTVTGTTTLPASTAFTTPALGAATATSIAVTGLIGAKSSATVPATAGAVAAGAPITIFSDGPSIYVTSDVPTFTAVKGSLCINTNGSSTSTRLYVNNGTTNWVAVTTAS